MLAHITAGNGLFDGLLHPLTGIDHLAAMLAVGVLAVLSRGRLPWWGLPAAFVGGLAAGGVLGLAGGAVGGLEPAIALTVLVVGLVIAFDVRAGVPVTVAAVAAAGTLHGWAHGAEAPALGHPALYAVGFLVASAALHATGGVAGLGLDRSKVLRALTGTGLGLLGATLLLG